MIAPVLIANRGEIAVRIARTAQALGLAVVAIFTTVDADAAHVDAADIATEVPSYLDIAAIIGAATTTGARSVHPGYGFLSENATFAQAVIDAGLNWIGPRPETIALMGDKARAKRLAREAGVPVVPGLEGEDLGLEELQQFCREHGFPAVIKALAGGGGKGMRVVRSADELEGGLDAARREAVAAFGDGRVLIERYLERPRHIEVQVLADQHGNVVHLGERECSLQRRHQKVVEEAPSPIVNQQLRAQMGQAAIDLARQCDYQNAGTIEFITPSDGSHFFFLEMNTRLQVEHPVTELVYGVDLVREQFHVAAGLALSLDQRNLEPRGHAIEARLYAEDPTHGFLPSTGTIRRYREPDGPGIRVDSGVREGTEVGTAYDPLLAKVIAHGPDRGTALQRLDRALATLEIVGVSTNAGFTRALLAEADVRAGELDTGLLERALGALDAGPPADLVPAAMVAAAGTSHPHGPWRRRLADFEEARVADGQVHIGEASWAAAIRVDSGQRARITLDGIERRYSVVVSEECVWLARDGHHLAVRTAAINRVEGGDVSGALEAPMPGTVLLVEASNGDVVGEGDLLLVLESMKMELAITAPHAGVVTGLSLSPGDRVSLGQPLVAVVLAEESSR